MNKRNFYDLLSKEYDTKYSNRLNQVMRKEEVKLLKNLPLGLTLDIGCGTGYHSKILKEIGHSVVSADISLEMVKKAKSMQNGNFFIVADVEKLPFKEDVFDNVVSIFGALNHANMNNFKLNLNSCLRRDGTLIFTVGNIYNIHWILKSIKQGKNPMVAIKKRKGKISINLDGKKISVRIRYYSIKELQNMFKDYSLKIGSLYPKLTFLPIINGFGRYIVLIGKKSF